MSFSIKTIRVTLVMAANLFGDNNAVVIEGLPVSVKVDKPGGQDLNKLSVTINNMALQKMEQLTILGFRPLQTNNNRIFVEAGVLGEPLDLVFSGEIKTAVPSFSDSGITEFKIEATAGHYPMKIASSPVSVKGEAKVEELMNQFAQEAGYAFKNEGVTVSVKNSIFKGSPVFKARTLARQVGIELLIDDHKFIIMPKGGHREGKAPKLSRESGLLGYPSFTNDGIDARSIYDSRLDSGGLVEIESIVPKSSGMWKIVKLSHDLEAYKPESAKWESSFSGTWVQEAK